MAFPFPDHERREVVASANVVVPWDVVRALPLGSRNDVIAPISIQWGKNCLQVHVNVTEVYTTRQEIHLYFSVDVRGLRTDIDTDFLYVKGEFSSVARNWLEVGRSQRVKAPPVAGRTGWRQFDGQLAEFVFATTREITGTVSVYGPPAVTKVLPDNSRLRRLGALHDVTLRAAGTEFPVHKAILGAHSPVFLTMFTGSFKEATDQVIDIAVDCRAEVFGYFIDFLYRGDLGRYWSYGDLMDLLDLGEQYMVEELNQQCVYLLQQMDPADALEVFNASFDRPSLPEKIRSKAVDVIIKNWATVCALDGWEAFSLTHPDAVRTLQAVVANDEGDVEGSSI